MPCHGRRSARSVQADGFRCGLHQVDKKLEEDEEAAAAEAARRIEAEAKRLTNKPPPVHRVRSERKWADLRISCCRLRIDPVI